MTEPQSNSNRLSGGQIQEGPASSDLKMVQRRAKKASDYYQVVLINGNLRRASDESATKRWSANSDSADVSDPISVTARSQPTTPVRVGPHRSGGRLKLMKNVTSTDDDDLESDVGSVDKARTLPRKIRAQDRVYDTSKARTVRLPGSPAGQRKLVDATNFCPPQPTSPERFGSVSKISDDAKRIDSRVPNSPTKAQTDNKDYTIVYTLPNARSKRQPARERTHYYEPVELPAQKERTHYYESVELPAKKERIRNYETIELSTLDGAKAPRHKVTVNASSMDSSPSKSPGRRQRSGSDSTDQLCVNGSQPTHRKNPDELPLKDFKRNKHNTIAGTTVTDQQHLEIRSNNATTPSPKGGSPVAYRRNKSKPRSKSNAVDHQYLFNQFQDLDDKDPQKLFPPCDPVITAELIRRRRHYFAHYDWKSMLFSFHDVIVAMETLKRKNTPSGASKAAALADESSSKTSSMNGSQEDVSSYLDDDDGFIRSNNLVASCPYFRNEIGGETDRNITITALSALSVQVRNHSDASTTQAQNVLTNHTFLSIVEHGPSPILPPNTPPSDSVRFGVENIDRGALYYRTHFYEKEHQNLVGIDDRFGPVVVSLKREKVEDKAVGSFYQYRLIVRTSELCTLRGSILEDVISGNRHPPSKGFSSKDVLEFVCPEVNASCLKLAMATPKVQEQIMKVDEHNMQDTYKVGVLYCKAGQVTEEDMYNNEHGSEAFQQFLDLLGRKVKLNGFDDFKGGLDVTTDSTGTESVFTTFNGYKIMFHVSTLLPFTATNKQQLLRKRHIGNDITTIVFQEPGSEPFNPQHVRSHFQHVFIVVRVHNPCLDNTCYSVAVTRDRSIPSFGPPIIQDAMFTISSTFREFLLTKVINGENTAHIAGKFKALAMNTREQYLRDLAVNSTSPGNLEGTPRFARFSITSSSRRNKDKTRQKSMPEELSRGGITWNVTVTDLSQSEPVYCVLGISDCVLAIVESDARKLIFSMPCQAILGWSVPPPTQEQMSNHQRDLHIFYGRGELLSLRTEEIEARDEVIVRLERFTKGSETIHRQLRRNAQGALGFNVNYEGIVMEVVPDGCAAEDGLKQSSRLVEICQVSVATMTHEQILDVLRQPGRVSVVIIPPFDDGTPRKCSKELYHLRPSLESQKADLSSVITPSPAGSFRSKSGTSASERRLKREAHYQVSHRLASTECASKDSSDPKMKRKHQSSNRGSFKKTNATLLATAAKLAMENDDTRTSSSNTLSSNKSSSSNHSNYSGADVDWTEGSTALRSRNNSSSESGFNSNNNSSHGSSLNRVMTKISTARESSDNHDVERRKPLFTFGLFNQNNNNSNNYFAPLSSVKRLRNDDDMKLEVCRSISECQETKITSQSHRPAMLTSSHFPTSHEPVSTGMNKLDSSLSSQSACEISNDKFRLSNASKQIASSVCFEKKKWRSSVRARTTSHGSVNEPRSHSDLDVQSSLIKLITHESPTRSSRSSSEKSPPELPSPKRKLSPLYPSSPLPKSIHRTSLGESTTKSRYSDGFGKSFKQGPQEKDFPRVSFPLPSSSDWEEILNAAKAAEALEGSASSNSVYKLSDFNGAPRYPSLHRVDEEGGVGACREIGSELVRDPTPNEGSSMFVAKLERIEREMKLLQEELKQERDCKKRLERELNSLRRHNYLLLEHLRSSSNNNNTYLNVNNPRPTPIESGST